MDNYKVMVVGDYGIGRTCTSIVFNHDQFPQEYIPTVYGGNNLKDVKINGKMYKVTVWEDGSCVMSVGDYGIGRTSTAIVFCTNQFPQEYIPSVYDVCPMNMKVKGKLCQVGAWEDDGSGEDYDRLRPLSYPQTDVFIAMYSVEKRESLKNVESRWIPEVRHYLPKVPVIIVANKIDLRDDPNINTVSYAEGYAMAQKMGTGYFEISALQMKGVAECFKHAVEVAMYNTKRLQKMRKKMNLPIIVIPPIQPPKVPDPVVTAASSQFADDYLPMVSNCKYHDVRFVADGGKCLNSHKIVLCSSSPLFRKLFLPQAPSDRLTNGFDKGDLNSGRVPGISSIEDDQDQRITTVNLSADIETETFTKLLEFAYTGQLDEKDTTVDVPELKREAVIFDLPELVTQCDRVLVNQERKKDPINIACTNDWKKHAMTAFYKQDTFSDMVFKVQDSVIIPSHRVVMSARSPKMAALLNSVSVEEGSQIEIPISDVSVENFTALLEYLYTDNTEVKNVSNAIDLLTVAYDYGAHRLVDLCEVCLKQELDCMNDQLDVGDVMDGIGLLQKYKACKATQMTDWCRHYVCQNFSIFSERKEFGDLDKEDRDYIKEHQWPPLDYIKEKRNFEAKTTAGVGQKTSGCILT